MTEYREIQAICDKLRREAELAWEHGRATEITVILSEKDWNTWHTYVCEVNNWDAASYSSPKYKYYTGKVTVTMYKE